MAFRQARRSNRRARIGLVGPSGSGKTFTAIQIAKGLGGRFAIADTENSSSELYADQASFLVQTMAEFSPESYIRVINEAVAEKLDTLIIDSLSHAWMGKGGILEIADKATEASRSKSSFDSWRKATPRHNELVDALIRAPINLIVTMRSKVEWIIEKDDRGRSCPRKVGLQPVQKDGLEYEFDIVGDMDEDNTLTISKSRCQPISEARVFRKPSDALGKQIREWLTSGAPAPSPASPPTSVDRRAELAALATDLTRDLAVALGVSEDDAKAALRAEVLTSRASTPEAYREAALRLVREHDAEVGIGPMYEWLRCTTGSRKAWVYCSDRKPIIEDGDASVRYELLGREYPRSASTIELLEQAEVDEEIRHYVAQGGVPIQLIASREGSIAEEVSEVSAEVHTRAGEDQRLGPAEVWLVVRRMVRDIVRKREANKAAVEAAEAAGGLPEV